MTDTDTIIINKSLDDSERILEILADSASGGDPKYQVAYDKAFKRYQEATREADPIWCRLAATYLEWCYTNPSRVGGLPRVFSECRCEWGFIEDEPGFWRPCQKCLPKTADKWAGFDANDLDEDERPMI